MTSPIHTRDQAKARARIIRKNHLAADGHPISYSAALERVAREQGCASWNVLSARLSNTPERPLQVGDRVAGLYLGQEFIGAVRAVRSLSEGRAFEIELEFDAPVDVVAFESFSNFRRRVRATVSEGGTSFAKTRDGVPHLVVAPAVGAGV